MEFHFGIPLFRYNLLPPLLAINLGITFSEKFNLHYFDIVIEFYLFGNILNIRPRIPIIHLFYF
jgi:hypothetical protein